MRNIAILSVFILAALISCTEIDIEPELQCALKIES